MSREYLGINRFGFAEYEDMVEISREVDALELTGILSSIVNLVLSAEEDFIDSLTDGAQADFLVPLGMCGKMLSAGEYSVMELVSAACTVRFCAESHMSEFPDRLGQMLSLLPR
ncbi:hypothetical protein ACH4A7_35835 [Streptomyces cyaneofuscatus]|uniref:hypothetical protein n=1 Tax=Streptomyces cyaneofuscatus TaxID=66883 RepID=UPI0037BB5BF1